MVTIPQRVSCGRDLTWIEHAVQDDRDELRLIDDDVAEMVVGVEGRIAHDGGRAHSVDEPRQIPARSG